MSMTGLKTEKKTITRELPGTMHRMPSLIRENKLIMIKHLFPSFDDVARRPRRTYSRREQ